MIPRSALLAILLMGAGAVITKMLDLWAWHAERRPMPAPVETSTNGGHNRYAYWIG